MKIYIEQVLLTNFIIDFCILTMTSKMIFSHSNYRRIALSALFGSISSIILPYCINAWLVNLLKILTAVIMLQILKPSNKKQLFMSFLSLLSLSYIIGGAILSHFGSNNSGGYTVSNISLPLIFTLTIICTFVCGKLVAWIKTRIIANSNILSTTLVHNSNSIIVKGMIDSGNALYDNNQPVSIINFGTFSKLTNVSLEEYLNNDFSKLTNAHFIDAHTISGSRKILVFTIKEMHLNSAKTKIFKNVSLGVSLHFDNTKEYKAILNSCFCLN